MLTLSPIIRDLTSIHVTYEEIKKRHQMKNLFSSCNLIIYIKKRQLILMFLKHQHGIPQSMASKRREGSAFPKTNRMFHVPFYFR